MKYVWGGSMLVIYNFKSSIPLALLLLLSWQ